LFCSQELIFLQFKALHSTHYIIDPWEVEKMKFFCNGKKWRLAFTSQLYSYLHLKPLPTFKGKAFLGKLNILFVSTLTGNIGKYKKVELFQNQ
jgi:hypothetical protein